MTTTLPQEERARRIAERIAALPADRWVRCPSCTAGLYRPRVRQHAHTCPECGHHFRITADERIELLVDPGSFTERDADLSPADPLGFTDSRPYRERTTQLAQRHGRPDAAVYGDAAVIGHRVVLCVVDFGFMGGSMGSVVGEKVCRAAESAAARRTPLIVCAASGGARMQEGVLSLMQMARTSAALRRLSRAGVPYLCVLTDPVYGGVTASFASLGDVIIAEPGTRAGFAGPQVIRQTIRQELPAGFQSAEFLLEHGHIDAIVPRKELRTTIAALLRFHQAAETASGTAPAARPASVPGGPATGAARAAGDAGDAWETVKKARDPGRPHLGEYVERVFEWFIELRGDRSREDDPAVTGGLALLDGRPVVVVGHRKGRGTAEGIARNFGMPHPAGYRKAHRLLRYAERFSVPVVTFVDTPGAYPGLRAEEENQSAAIAENLALLSDLAVPVVAVVIGEGGSGGALALGVGDRLLMLANTVYSVISPEGCATILYQDAAQAPRAAAALKLTAYDLLELGIADELLPEPEGGAQADHDAVAATVREALLRHLDDLCARPPADLVADRYRKLRALGRYEDGRPHPDAQTAPGEETHGRPGS